MSRIDEALKQAGKSVERDPGTPPGLEAFPTTAEPSAQEQPAPALALNVHNERPGAPAASSDMNSARLVVDSNVGPVVVEQYRRLAAVLHQAQSERGIKVLMLASAQTAEGKSLTAANLALTLSESYRRRVLLIDADLRRPTIGTLFGVDAPIGLSECLKAPQLQQLRVINVTESLGILLAGRPDTDPMQGLTSGRMQEIIEQAVGSFDWVILDTPPIELLTDAHLLVAMVDAAVLVIDAGTTQHPIVLRAVESLGREKIVGVVLNRVDDAALAESTYYEYYRGGSRSKRRRRYLAQTNVAPEISA